MSFGVRVRYSRNEEKKMSKLKRGPKFKGFNKNELIASKNKLFVLRNYAIDCIVLKKNGSTSTIGYHQNSNGKREEDRKLSLSSTSNNPSKSTTECSSDPKEDTPELNATSGDGYKKQLIRRYIFEKRENGK